MSAPMATRWAATWAWPTCSRQAGHDVTVLSADPLPEIFAPFLQGRPPRRWSSARTAPGPPPDAWVILDTSDPVRLGNVYTPTTSCLRRAARAQSRSPPDQPANSAQLNMMDAAAAAVAEQIPLLLRALGLDAGRRRRELAAAGPGHRHARLPHVQHHGAHDERPPPTDGARGRDSTHRRAVFNTRPLSQVLLWSRALARRSRPTGARSGRRSAARCCARPARKEEEPRGWPPSWPACAR